MLKEQQILIRSFMEGRDIFQTLIAVCQIPSPTFHEEKKIRFLAEQLRSLGLKDVKIDAIGNCTGMIINDSKQKKFVLVSAHADTACVAPVPIQVQEKNGFLFAHSICDNSAGVTAVLTLLSFLKEKRVKLRLNYMIAFTVGEEGLGAKRGMKEVMKKNAKNVDYVVNVESHDIGRITNSCVGQFRAELKVTAKQKGAHSWRNFGEPNAVVILSQIISDFCRVKVPEKTTYNFTAIKGGEGINAIPNEAQCLFECRSAKQKNIDSLVQKLKSSMARFSKDKVKSDLKVLATAIGASIDSNHALYKITEDVHKFLKIKSFYKGGNTDGDVPLSLGIPTVTIGSSNGFATHSLEEHLEKKTFRKGVEQILMVLLCLDQKMH